MLQGIIVIGVGRIQRKGGANMLKSIQDKNLTIWCQCGTERVESAEGVSLKFLPEFGEYQNYMSSPCPNCGIVEGYNMNLPLDELEDEIPTYEMPEEEEIQRYYVRLLIRLCREDFKI